MQVKVSIVAKLASHREFSLQPQLDSDKTVWHYVTLGMSILLYLKLYLKVEDIIVYVVNRNASRYTS